MSCSDSLPKVIETGAGLLRRFSGERRDLARQLRVLRQKLVHGLAIRQSLISRHRFGIRRDSDELSLESQVTPDDAIWHFGSV